jgi:flagellar protein FliS
VSYGPSASSRYLENDVMSRSREWLVPLLYEHLVGSLRRLQVHFDQNDFVGMARDGQKATRILTELLATLDEVNGGKIAADLGALYSFYLSELLPVVRRRDRNALVRITKQFEGLHEAWVKAAEQVAPRGARPATPQIIAAG